MYPSVSVRDAQQLRPYFCRHASHDPINGCPGRSTMKFSHLVIEAFQVNRRILRCTFGLLSVKLILSTKTVTKLNGNGVDGSKFGIFTCCCMTHTAKWSISSISRPRRTLPKNVTYLSCNAASLDNGMMADVNESAIDLTGNSANDFGSNFNKYSRLCCSTEYFGWIPNNRWLSVLTANYQIVISNISNWWNNHIYRYSLCLLVQSLLDVCLHRYHRCCCCCTCVYIAVPIYHSNSDWQAQISTSSCRTERNKTESNEIKWEHEINNSCLLITRSVNKQWSLSLSVLSFSLIPC